MALVVDANALYAQADRRDPRHGPVTEVLKAERGLLVTSQIAAAEADYLILRRLGVDVELDFLAELAEGVFVVDCLDREDLSLARDLVERYHDLRLGLADASLVVLAHRYRTHRILTLDARAFRVVRPIHGEAFEVLPGD